MYQDLSHFAMVSCYKENNIMIKDVVYCSSYLIPVYLFPRPVPLVVPRQGITSNRCQSCSELPAKLCDRVRLLTLRILFGADVGAIVHKQYLNSKFQRRMIAWHVLSNLHFLEMVVKFLTETSLMHLYIFGVLFGVLLASACLALFSMPIYLRKIFTAWKERFFQAAALSSISATATVRSGKENALGGNLRRKRKSSEQIDLSLPEQNLQRKPAECTRPVSPVAVCIQHFRRLSAEAAGSGSGWVDTIWTDTPLNLLPTHCSAQMRLRHEAGGEEVPGSRSCEFTPPGHPASPIARLSKGIRRVSMTAVDWLDVSSPRQQDESSMFARAKSPELPDVC